MAKVEGSNPFIRLIESPRDPGLSCVLAGLGALASVGWLRVTAMLWGVGRPPVWLYVRRRTLNREAFACAGKILTTPSRWKSRIRSCCPAPGSMGLDESTQSHP